MRRKQWNQILKAVEDVPCPRASCVYNENGICGDPDINYGNGDAECHRMSYKQVVTMLGLSDYKFGGSEKYSRKRKGGS